MLRLYGTTDPLETAKLELVFWLRSTLESFGHHLIQTNL